MKHDTDLTSDLFFEAGFAFLVIVIVGLAALTVWAWSG